MERKAGRISKREPIEQYGDQLLKLLYDEVNNRISSSEASDSINVLEEKVIQKNIGLKEWEEIKWKARHEVMVYKAMTD